nr:hypothetical protein [Tanacetum cinerariifolium]
MSITSSELECLPLGPLTDDNLTSALSAVLTSLSFRKAPVDKVPVLRVQRQ